MPFVIDILKKLVKLQVIQNIVANYAMRTYELQQRIQLSFYIGCFITGGQY